MKNIAVQNKIIGPNQSPFLIAEISANHKNNIKRVYKIINAAVKAGFDAIKVQTYTADTITLKSNKKDFKILDKKSIWYGKSLHNIYTKGSMPWNWHKKLSNYCKKKKIIFFSTPFDESAIDLLEKLNIPIYKISSFEITHYPLLKKIAKTKKPIIISTGMATKKEIQMALKTLYQYGAKKIILLRCNSTYPAPIEESNLMTIRDMSKIFKVNIGLSDHTIGSLNAISAIALGATVIEKHVTISKNDGGLDSIFSLEIKDFRKFVENCRNTKKIIGKVYYGPSKREKPSLKYRRSIYVSRNINKGEKITKNNIKIVRPALGLNVKFYDKVLGMKAKKNLKIADIPKIQLLKK
jgi:pseudaminic acid synthase